MIGNWDNSNVLAACLPKCLESGTNPESFNSGLFPIYSNIDGYTTSGSVHLSGTYVNGYIDCTSGGVLSIWANPPNRRLLDLTTDVTIDVTFTFKAFSKFITFDVSEEPGRFYHLFINTALNGVVAFQTYNDNNDNISVSVKNQYIQVGQKYTYTVVKEGTDQRIYVNGQPVAIENYLAKNNFSGQMITERIYWGTSDGTPSTSFIHRGIVYGKALQDAEVLALYNLGDNLGGLLGYDNLDGTMSLSAPSTSTSVSATVDDEELNIVKTIVSGDKVSLIYIDSAGDFKIKNKYFEQTIGTNATIN